MLAVTIALLLWCCPSPVQPTCFEPSPAFPVPEWQHGGESLATAFRSINTQLEALISEDKYSTTSYSIEVTSQTSTLWTSYHTAQERDNLRPGVAVVDSESIYRIASISKVFTVLGILQQHSAGNLSLDDPVTYHIPELAEPDAGEIPWKDITLRSMASQLSGIPSDFGLADLMSVPDPTQFGLPPASSENLPECLTSDIVCTRNELFKSVKNGKPVFAPNQKSSYSNLAFTLLGVVLENVAGMNYSRYVETEIMKPLNMTFASLETPSDEHAVLPLGPSWWDIDEGVNRPTGGVYASSGDMSKFVRYIMAHYNALATGINWLMPASYSESGSNYYGMPFEIYRPDNVLPNTLRPVTIVTKAGALPGYFSRMFMLPEYGLGLTILIAGNAEALDKTQRIVLDTLLPVAEDLIWKNIGRTHDGTYMPYGNDELKTTLTLTTSASTGLTLTDFISNSTNVLHTILPLISDVDPAKPWNAQLVPTLLYKDEKKQRGEIWRMLVVQDRTNRTSVPWDDFCIAHWELATYAGLPVNEVVFWGEGRIELPAWRVNLTKTEGSRLAVQDL